MDADELNSGPTNVYRNRFARGAAGTLPFQQDDGTGEDSVWPDAQAEEEEEQKKRATESLYAVLNLPKSATPSQIRERYRQLAVLFHPDKQPTGPDGPSSDINGEPSPSSRHPYEDDARPPRSRKEIAETQFAEINRAYEVLIDPQKRTIYDMLGEEGLRTSWEVGLKGMSADEMKAHYQRQAYEKKLHSIESMVKSKGSIQCSLDARAVFLSTKFFKDPSIVSHDPISRMQRLRVQQLVMKHDFETPLSKNTQIVWAGQMLSRNGGGGGNIVGTVRHQFSPRLWAEVGTSLLKPRVGTAKVTASFADDSFLTVNAVQQTLNAPPALAATFGRSVFGMATAFVTIRSGFWELGSWGRGLAGTLGRNDRPALSVGLTNVDQSGEGWTLETTGGFVDNHVSLDYSIKLLDGVKLKVGSSIGTVGGLTAFINGERQMTQFTRFGLGVSASVPGGISMKLRFWRLGQKVVLPIMLSPDVNPSVLFFSTVLPACSFLALHHLYIVPKKRRKVKDRLRRLQRQHAEYASQKRAEALDAISIMQEQVARKAEQERANEAGLVIVSAKYGLLEDLHNGVEEGSSKIADVTIPVQALVQTGHLYIPGDRPKFNILGFYDPCIGEPKALAVTYLFRKRLHRVIVEDLGVVRAPLRAHRVEDVQNESWEA